MASQTQQATAELSSVDLEIDWDDNCGDFTVCTVDLAQVDCVDFNDNGKYHPSNSDRIFIV